jgi:hypothetical protein
MYTYIYPEFPLESGNWRRNFGLDCEPLLNDRPQPILPSLPLYNNILCSPETTPDSSSRRSYCIQTRGRGCYSNMSPPNRDWLRIFPLTFDTDKGVELLR